MRLTIPVMTLLLFTACNNEVQQHEGPIVLGDSSTIVTETDPKYMEDMVADLTPKPLIPVAAPEATSVQTQDTAVTSTTATPAITPTNSKGMTLAFKEVTLFIPGIETYSYKQQDLSKTNSATYELRGGKLAGNEIEVTKGNVTKVSQRYQTQLALQSGGKTLLLSSLGNYLSGWEQISSNGSKIPLKGLDQKSIDYRKVSAAQVRSAVQKTARSQRLSKAETANWEKVALTYKSNNQSPAQVVLTAVMWRVEGKGFWKEIRMDVP